MLAFLRRRLDWLVDWWKRGHEVTGVGSDDDDDDVSGFASGS